MHHARLIAIELESISLAALKQAFSDIPSTFIAPTSNTSTSKINLPVSVCAWAIEGPRTKNIKSNTVFILQSILLRHDLAGPELFSSYRLTLMTSPVILSIHQALGTALLALLSICFAAFKQADLDIPSIATGSSSLKPMNKTNLSSSACAWANDDPKTKKRSNNTVFIFTPCRFKNWMITCKIEPTPPRRPAWRRQPS